MLLGGDQLRTCLREAAAFQSYKLLLDGCFDGLAAIEITLLTHLSIDLCE